MTSSWDPKVYGQFLSLRTRPARDLLAGIPESFQPKIACDLGCGPATEFSKN
jgi:trans-aconitate 2-methyltransferase